MRCGMRLHATSTDDLLAHSPLAAGAAGAAGKVDFRVRGFGGVATFRYKMQLLCTVLVCVRDLASERVRKNAVKIIRIDLECAKFSRLRRAIRRTRQALRAARAQKPES